MPSVSRKQHNFMGMIKHSPEMARKAGVPQRVGADFIAADRRAGRYAEGGEVEDATFTPVAAPAPAPVPPAASDPLAGDTLTSLMYARHLQQQPWMNRNVYGAGVQHQLSPDVAAMAGYYRNTMDRPSFYGGVEWMPWHHGRWSAGADMGAVSGYGGGTRHLPAVLPAVAPTLTYQATPRLGVQGTVMLDPTHWGNTALGLGLRYKLGSFRNGGLARMAPGGSVDLSPMVEPRGYADGGDYDSAQDQPQTLEQERVPYGDIATQAAQLAGGVGRGWAAGLAGLPQQAEALQNVFMPAWARSHAMPSSDEIMKNPHFLPFHGGAAGSAGQQIGQPLGDWGAGAGTLARTAARGPGGLGALLQRAAELSGTGPPSGGPAAQLGAVKLKGGNWAPWNLSTYLEDIGGEHEMGDAGAQAVTDWKNKQLARYIKTYLGTAQDPLLALEQQGQLHMDPRQLHEMSDQYGIAPAENGGRGAFRVNLNSPENEFHENVTGRLTRTPWENLADAQVRQRSAKDVMGQIENETGEMPGSWYPTFPSTMETPESHIQRNYGWLAKDPSQRVWDLAGQVYGVDEFERGADLLGFGHVLDYLRQSGMSPAQLSRVSVPDAVRMTAEWNARMAKGATQPGHPLNVGILGVHKEYPATGFHWVQLGPEGLDAEGKAMGHCVGSYCEDVRNRGTQIYSLRDADNQPHVTVEARPGKFNYLNAAGDMTNEQSAAVQQQLENAGYRMNTAGQWVAVGSGLPRGMRMHPEVLADAVKTVAPDLYAAHTAPPDIMQIKGKQNAAPVKDYLPYVQDFVKNGNWGAVGDLHNTGLVDVRKGRGEAMRHLYSALPGQPSRNAVTLGLGRARAAGALPHDYMTSEELKTAVAPHIPEEGDPDAGDYATGGPIRMGHGIRTAATAPTTMDPVVAHLMRHAPRINAATPSPYPLRMAQGGEFLMHQAAVDLANHDQWMQEQANAAAG